MGAVFFVSLTDLTQPTVASALGAFDLDRRVRVVGERVVHSHPMTSLPPELWSAPRPCVFPIQPSMRSLLVWPAPHRAPSLPLAVRRLYRFLPARICLAGTGSEVRHAAKFRPAFATVQCEFGSIASMKLGITEREQPSLRSCCQGAVTLARQLARPS